MLTATKGLTAVLILFGSSQVVANASTILSSYSGTQEGTSFQFSSSKSEAIGFITGSSDRYEVNTVKLRLSSSARGEVSVGIYDTAIRTRECGWSLINGFSYCSYKAPGELIGSVSIKAVEQKDDYSFGFSDVGLQPDALYWVVFQGIDAGTFRYFENAFDPSWYDPLTSYSNWMSSYKSDTGAKIYDFASSPCSTNNWCPTSTLGMDWQYHSGLNIVEINGIVADVPNPATAGLFAIGMAGLIGARKRRVLKRD